MTRSARPAVAGLVLAAAVLAAALLVAACGPGGSPTPSPIETGALGSPLASGATVDSPVDGIPVDIDAKGFTDIAGFTIRTADGRELHFALGPLENGNQFPPSHLAEHLASSSAVRVWFRDEGGQPTAYRLEDAPAP